MEFGQPAEYWDFLPVLGRINKTFLRYMKMISQRLCTILNSLSGRLAEQAMGETSVSESPRGAFDFRALDLAFNFVQRDNV